MLITLMTSALLGSLFLFSLLALKSLNMPGGRPFDPVWKHFKREDTSSGSRAICRGCLTAFAGNPKRLKAHSDNCGRLQAVISKGDLPSLSVCTVSTPTSSSSKHRQLLLSSVSTAVLQRHTFDLQLCRFVLATAIPFRAIGHLEFKKLIELLRPGCALAGERDVAGGLFDEVHALWSSCQPLTRRLVQCDQRPSIGSRLWAKSTFRQSTLIFWDFRQSTLIWKKSKIGPKVDFGF